MSFKVAHSVGHKPFAKDLATTRAILHDHPGPGSSTVTMRKALISRILEGVRSTTPSSGGGQSIKSTQVGDHTLQGFADVIAI